MSHNDIHSFFFLDVLNPAALSLRLLMTSLISLPQEGLLNPVGQGPGLTGAKPNREPFKENIKPLTGPLM